MKRARETRRNDSLDTSFDNDACNRVEMERHRIIILLSRYNRSSILISRMCIVTNDVYFQVLSNYIIIINACISICVFYFLFSYRRRIVHAHNILLLPRISSSQHDRRGSSRDWILKREALIRVRKKKGKNDLEERRGVGEGKVSINKILA